MKELIENGVQATSTAQVLKEAENPLQSEVDNFGFDVMLKSSKYFKFIDFTGNGMDNTKQIAVVKSDGSMQFQTHVQSKNTHTKYGLRGPWFYLRFLDSYGLVLFDWSLGQVNYGCDTSYYYIRQENRNIYNDVASA